MLIVRYAPNETPAGAPQGEVPVLNMTLSKSDLNKEIETLFRGSTSNSLWAKDTDGNFVLLQRPDPSSPGVQKLSSDDFESEDKEGEASENSKEKENNKLIKEINAIKGECNKKESMLKSVFSNVFKENNNNFKINHNS